MLYSLFVQYDLEYLDIQYSIADNLFDGFNLIDFKFLVWQNYLVDSYLNISKGTITKRLPSVYQI